MTDKKVSALTDGTTANATDRIPVARSPFGSGDNAYITPAYLDTYMASTTKTLTNKTLTSPTLTTPTLGVATATSINKVALTAPATGSTLTIADGKTLTANNSLTFAGTDSTTMTFPSTSATIARTDAGNTFTGAQTISGGTVNGTVLDISQTWGSTGTYTGIKYDVTDSGPSNAASLLMDLQVGSSSKFKVSKSGTITSALAGGGTAVLYGGFSGFGLGFDGSGGPVVLLGNGAGNYRYRLATNFELANVSSIAWCSSWAATSQDTFITRSAAATLQLGAADTTLATAPTAQTLQVQSWLSSTSPNQAGANFTIAGSAGTGSGAGGSIIFQVAPATGAGGTTKNPYATALTINSAQQIIAAINGSAAAPAIAFGGRGSGTNWGFAATGASNICAVIGGTETQQFWNDGSIYASGTNAQIVAKGNNGTIALGSSIDTILARDAANTLALRNSTNAQTFRTYYRYDDASNYAFGYMEAGVTANTLILGSNKVGSPAQALTKLQINVDGTSKADYGVSSASQWTFAGTTNVGALNIGTAGYLVWISRGSINANADGVYAWMNAAGNDFGRLQFGGTTSSFPALKRNGASLDLRLADDSGYANLAVQQLTCSQGVAIGSSHTVGWNSNGSYLFGNATTGANTGTMRLVASGGTSCLNFGGDTSSFPSLKRSSTALHARLADDSAYAPFSAELVTVAAGTATPAGGSTAGRLLMGTTAGFGVYYGSGAPTVSAAQGSIYLRSDGSSTSTRLYVNTDGSTTWTAVTTAA